MAINVSSAKTRSESRPMSDRPRPSSMWTLIARDVARDGGGRVATHPALRLKYSGVAFFVMVALSTLASLARVAEAQTPVAAPVEVRPPQVVNRVDAVYPSSAGHH